MAELINGFSFRGTTTIDVVSTEYYVNSTETNGSQISLATNFAVTGVTDAVLTVYGGNKIDNMNNLAEYDIDASPKEIPINVGLTYKYIQIGITMNGATEITYKVDALGENSKTRN